MDKSLFIGLTCILLFSTNIYGQADCSVLKAEISLIYKGECKNGFAHGYGEASGRDNYIGQFRRGLPHGTGIYTWSTGEEYDGGWKKGLRNGFGTYTFISGGKDSLLQGNWMDDEFKGIKESDAVKVIMKRDITRYKPYRRGNGRQVLINIIFIGIADSTIEEFMFLSNSGNEIRIHNATGYDNVEFPFWGKVTYSVWNRAKTARYNVVFEFEVLQPGSWEISLYN